MGDQFNDFIQPGDQLLLDLSRIESSSHQSIQGKLSYYCATIAERRAYLVVVMPQGLEFYLQPKLLHLVVPIGPPNRLAALWAHLREDGLDLTEADSVRPRIAELLTSAPMRDVFELARLIRIASESYAGDLSSWTKEAIAAITDRSKQVVNDVRGIRKGRQRALLLATAMLNGARVDTLDDAANRLLKIIDHPPEIRPLLQQRSLAERFTAFPVLIEEGGHVRFEQLAYDMAVRAYFWTYYPGLRAAFRTWIDELVKLGSADHEQLVIRFAEQCLRIGRPLQRLKG
ncbi:hypothetical protein AB0J35_61055 [Nonomuraea angiospora]|uniref:hypothetical protein n=1 Tax=Nonomuraea angiospora TaxID=46172 RepID=UPI00341AA8C8